MSEISNETNLNNFSSLIKNFQDQQRKMMNIIMEKNANWFEDWFSEMRFIKDVLCFGVWLISDQQYSKIQDSTRKDIVESILSLMKSLNEIFALYDRGKEVEKKAIAIFLWDMNVDIHVKTTREFLSASEEGGPDPTGIMCRNLIFLANESSETNARFLRAFENVDVQEYVSSFSQKRMKDISATLVGITIQAMKLRSSSERGVVRRGMTGTNASVAGLQRLPGFLDNIIADRTSLDREEGTETSWFKNRRYTNIERFRSLVHIPESESHAHLKFLGSVVIILFFVVVIVLLLLNVREKGKGEE